MELDIYQCQTCFYTEHQPAGQASIFLEKCPRCTVGNMEKTGAAVSSQEYDARTKQKMRDLKNILWRF